MKVVPCIAALTCVTVAAFGVPHVPPATAAVVTVESAEDFGLLVDSPGVYWDERSGRMVVTVTSGPAATRVRVHGAIPRAVPRNKARLSAAVASLEREVRVPGTSWGVDPVSNKVVVSIDGSVSGADLTRVRAAAARLGDAVRLEHVPGVLSAHIGGGDAIYGGNVRCSLAFNVHDQALRSYFLTAGHCANARLFYSDAARRNLVGIRSHASFPGDDYAIYHFVHGRTSNYGVINNRVDIRRSGNAVVGQRVRRTGSSTGTRSGRVIGVNVTVNYASGRMYGMVLTNACSAPGDSGGPYYDGATALGIHSGGNGRCGPGAVTVFQPVTEVLARYGVHVY